MKTFFKSIIILGAFMLLAGCGQTRSLIIITYNVGAFGKYMDDSTMEISGLVKSLGADAVALNELDSCNRRHEVYQLEKFSKALGGWDYAYSSSFPFAGGSYGNGIVTQGTIIHREKVLLPMSDGVEQRSMMVVETEDYVVACTHLDHKGNDARVDQARFIDSWMREKYGKSAKPVFLCGDMNAIPDSPAVKALLENWTLLSVTDSTWPSHLPAKCIDYIFCLDSQGRYHILDSKVISFPEVSQLSDHLPVMVKIEYKN